jgi:ABC-type arginine transport system permease subunit
VAPGRLRRVWRAAQALGISALMILMALAVRLPLGGAWRAAMPGGLA